MRLFAAILVFMHLALSSGTAAQADALAECNNSQDPMHQRRACSSVIQSGKLDRANLALAYVNGGNAYAASGNSNQAFADYAAAIRLDPQGHLAYYNGGNVYFDQKRYGQAIADYTASIARDPSFGWSLYSRGVAYKLTGEVDKAIADFRAALAIDPSLGAARENLKLLEGRV